MKAATKAVQDTIKYNLAVNAQPRVRAEWEYNRFSDINEIWAAPTQTSTDADYTTVWDINSLGLPNRPRTGIAKARIDEPSVMAIDQYRDYPQAARFYPADPSDTYKYWSSADRTHLDAAFDGGYEFDNPITVSLKYQQPVDANKIVIGFETSYSKPLTFSVAVSVDGDNYNTVSSNPVIEADGTVTLWLNDVHEWDTVPFYDATTPLQGVQVTVYSMVDPYVCLDVLQLGLRLENDLTDFVVKYDTEMQMSDRSFVVPLGRASSNQATVTLSNTDGRFNNDNVNSLYYGLIEKRVKFIIELGIDASQQSGTKYEYIREFTGWVDSWGSETATSTDVTLKDSSVFLQNMQMPQVFFEGSTVGAIVWQTMDRIGMADYSYTRAEAESGTVIPYYWPDNGKFVWDEFQDIAEATQYGIWFDEYDVLQIRSRETLFNSADPVMWNFDAVPNGQKLPDIVDLDVSKDLMTNDVIVTWKPTHFSDFNNGFPKMEQVWSPTATTTASGGTVSTGLDPYVQIGTTQQSTTSSSSTADTSSDVVLRSCPITKPILPTDDSFWIRQADAAFWDYTGIVNISGEMIGYSGKEYTYYKVGGGTATIILTSLADKNNIDTQASDPNLSWKNYFTGRLMIKNRAMFGTTTPALIPFEPFQYNKYVTDYGNTINFPVTAGMSFNNGFVRCTNPTGIDYATVFFKNATTTVLPHTSKTVTFGTRVRFPNLDGKIADTKSDGTPDIPTIPAQAGLYFAGDDGRGGLALEICPTQFIDDIEKRVWRHEVSLVGYAPGQTAWRFVSPYNTETGQKDISGNPLPDDEKGYRGSIFYDQWYDIDLKMSGPDGSGNFLLMAYIDSVYAGQWTVGGAIYNSFRLGRFGMFIRGNTTADFDYSYAVEVDDDGVNPDETGFTDLVAGDFTSGHIERYWRYGYGYYGYQNQPYAPESELLSTRSNSPMLMRSNYAFDEFGPQAHEVRQYSVKFNDSNVPCEHSFLYFTNMAQAVCLYYEANAFGADFMIANAYRDNAVLNGSDDYSFPGQTINHTMFIYGRQLYQDDDQTVEKRHDLSIKRRGQAQVTFNSKFIQTQEMADGMGIWIAKLWGTGVEEATMNVFGNVLVQLGDLVTINYPVKNYDPDTHKYFVVDIRNTFDGGYKTELTLRRAAI